MPVHPGNGLILRWYTHARSVLPAVFGRTVTAVGLTGSWLPPCSVAPGPPPPAG